MSASLVGSEMCIRDRCPSPFNGALDRAWMCMLRRRAEFCTHLHFAQGAVSYTHLTLPTICSV
eukprot:7360498-Alexandrium_andersonii.AAC.1